MHVARPAAPRAAPPGKSAEIAKAALLRLAAQRLEPTPENYALAYRLEADNLGASMPGAGVGGVRGVVEQLAQQLLDATAAARLADELERGRVDAAERAIAAARVDDGEALAALIEQLLRGVEVAGRGWTVARKKESVRRVLDGSRVDPRRLRQRLAQPVAAWEGDPADGPLPSEFAGDGAAAAAAADPSRPADAAGAAGPAAAATGVAAGASDTAGPLAAVDLAGWRRIVSDLSGVLGDIVSPPPEPGPAIAQALAGWPPTAAIWWRSWAGSRAS